MRLPRDPRTASPPDVGAEELADALRHTDAPVVADTRSRTEYRWGHVPGARSVPLHRLARGLPEPAVRGRVVVISATGLRARLAARLLRRRGWDAARLRRGMRGWWAADLPTAPGDAVRLGNVAGPSLSHGHVLPGDDPRAYRRALEATTGVPATDGNEVTVLRNGVEIFPAMHEAVRGARHTIDFLTFVYWTGDVAREFASALSDRAREGVRVRVLLDGWGASPMDTGLVHEMRDAGARVEWFRPVIRDLARVNHRTHRKVLVCDGAVAFTGGVGIAAEWEGDARHPGEWRDTHFRIEGPAVRSLLGGFVGNWIEAGGSIAEDDEPFPDVPATGDCAIQVVRSQSAAAGITDAEMALRALVRLARGRIRIATAYFEPDRPFVRLLRDAASRGVEIDVLVPGPHTDKRLVKLAQHGEVAHLLAAGIRFWRYQPTMLHTKVMTVDGLVACVGSVNINSRSLRKDDELGVVIHDAGTVGTLDSHFDADLARSEPIRAREWHDGGMVRRAGRKLAGALDAWI